MSQQINLFNPIFLAQRKYFSMLAMLQALALVALGAGLFYAYAAYQVQQVERQFADAARRFAADQQTLARYQAGLSPQQSQQLLLDEMSRVEQQLAAQNELIATLKSGVIGNTTGYSEYMLAFARQSIQGLWLTGFNITGDATQMTMHGAALQPELLPAYVRRLNHEKIMRGKSFAALQMQQAEGASPRFVKFTLQSEVSNEAAP